MVAVVQSVLRLCVFQCVQTNFLNCKLAYLEIFRVTNEVKVMDEGSWSQEKKSKCSVSAEMAECGYNSSDSNLQETQTLN